MQTSCENSRRGLSQKMGEFRCAFSINSLRASYDMDGVWRDFNIFIPRSQKRTGTFLTTQSWILLNSSPGCHGCICEGGFLGIFQIFHTAHVELIVMCMDIVGVTSRFVRLLNVFLSTAQKCANHAAFHSYPLLKSHAGSQANLWMYAGFLVISGCWCK